MFQVVGKEKVGGPTEVRSKGEDDEEDEQHKRGLDIFRSPIYQK